MRIKQWASILSTRLVFKLRGRKRDYAEKIATLETLDYLEKRAERGSRDKLLAVLEKAPDVEPEDDDKL